MTENLLPCVVQEPRAHTREQLTQKNDERERIYLFMFDGIFFARLAKQQHSEPIMTLHVSQ